MVDERHAFLRIKSGSDSAGHTEDKGEPIHCLIKMEIGAGHERSRELLEQEAGDFGLLSIRDSIVESPITALRGR